MFLRTRHRNLIIFVAYIIAMYILVNIGLLRWIATYNEETDSMHGKQDAYGHGFIDEGILKHNLDGMYESRLIEDKIFWSQYAVKKVPKGIS